MHNTNYHGPVSANWFMWKSKTNSATEEHCTISLRMARCFYPTFIWLMSYLYSASGWSLLFWLWGWQKWLWIVFKVFLFGIRNKGLDLVLIFWGVNNWLNFGTCMIEMNNAPHKILWISSLHHKNISPPISWKFPIFV